MIKHDVKNLKLAAAGKKKILWAAKQMDVLNEIKKDFKKKNQDKKNPVSR